MQTTLRLLSAVFDDFKMAGNAISQLEKIGLTDSLSFITRSLPDEETISRLDEEFRDPTQLDVPYTGAAAGSLSDIYHRFISFSVAGIGQLTGAGPLIDLILISPYISGQKSGGLPYALSQAGLSIPDSRFYSNLISQGRFIIFIIVTQPDLSEIIDLLQDTGVLQTDVLTFNPNKTQNSDTI